jgi:hypothetical protein
VTLGGAQLTIRHGLLTTSPAPREVADALVEAQVTEAAGQRSGFQLRFALARDGVLERELLPGGFFDPPARFILTVTVGGVPAVLSDGIVGQVDVAQAADAGGSTLSVTGTDLSQVMDQLDLSGVPMPAMPPLARVSFILLRYLPWGVAALAVPSILDVPPNPLRQIPAQQGTDFAYLTQLADEAGYVFYVEPGPATGTSVAYWGPEIRIGPAQPPLRVNMGPSSNVDALSFTFDGLKKTLYAAWVNDPLTHISAPVPLPGVNPLTPPNGPKVPVPLAFSQLGHAGSSDHDTTDASAKFDVATTIVRGLARAAQTANVVRASGSLDVRRYGRLLQPRRLINVQGGGLPFDGQYFTSSVTTTLRRGSLTQSFALERNALMPFDQTVPVG